MRKPRKIETRDQQINDANQLAVTAWWLEFESTAQFRKLRSSLQHIMPFVAYVTMHYLFRRYARETHDCSCITVQDVATFLVTTGPNNIVVDAPTMFVNATILWLQWLCQMHGRLLHAAAIEKCLRNIRQDAVNAMTSEHGSMSKELILRARSAGIDLADNYEILRFFIERDPSCSNFYEEFLLPPHPIFSKGRKLYVHDWPPEKEHLEN